MFTRLRPYVALCAMIANSKCCMSRESLFKSMLLHDNHRTNCFIIGSRYSSLIMSRAVDVFAVIIECILFVTSTDTEQLMRRIVTLKFEILTQEIEVQRLITCLILVWSRILGYF
jgi:hypothetical protein